MGGGRAGRGGDRRCPCLPLISLPCPLALSASALPPADLNFIGVAFQPPDELCPTYLHQQAPVLPPNLYRAQLARRQRLELQKKSLPGPARALAWLGKLFHLS